MSTNYACTYLAYSAGKASHAIIEMVLRGHIPKPVNFVVIRADPGMEDERSHSFAKHVQSRCAEQGIPYIHADGPNLYSDLVGIPTTTKTRIDLPPYWTVDPDTKKIGRLTQRCTRQYKIRPMRRALRMHLAASLGISPTTKHLPKCAAWIGFTADEAHRVSPSDCRYVDKLYPLIEHGYDNAKLHGYYMQHEIPVPPRSVCVACFANGLKYFEDMYYERPDDWSKAVAVDKAIRDMRKLDVKHPAFVSATGVPLEELAEMDFKRSDDNYKTYRCNSGMCFT